MALHVGTVGPVIRADNMEPEVLRQLTSVLSGARDGILHGTDLAVTQNGGGAMSIIVSSGFALISGTDSAPVQGQYHVYNDANVTVTVPTANGSNPRIDLIVATIEDAYYAGASNTAILQDIAGTPAASPTVPATPADSLVLAHIYVGTGVGSILTANINGTTGTNNPDTVAFAPLRAEGIIAKAVGSGGTITATAAPGTLIPGAQVAFQATANRVYRFRYSVQVTKSVATAVAICVPYLDGTGGTLEAAGYSYVDTGSTSGTLVGEVILTGLAAGMHTIGPYAYSTSAQTLTFTASRGTFTIEDIGPA